MDEYGINFIYFDYEDEERYLNEKSREGWAFTSIIPGRCSFEASVPGRYCYRIFFTPGVSHRDFEELRASLAQDGIELVERFGGKAYFRSEKDFEIYSPKEKKALYRKLAIIGGAAALGSLVLCSGAATLTFKHNKKWAALLAPLLASAGLYGYGTYVSGKKLLDGSLESDDEETKAENFVYPY